MEKQYVYRKHLREPFKYLATMFLFFLGVYAIIAAMIITTSDIIDDKILGIIIFAIVGGVISVIIIIEYIIAYFTVFRKFKNVSVKLMEDRIIYNNIKGETVIPYGEITGLEFPSLRYLGGWVKIKYRNGNIRITVVLENIGDFLKNLKNKLDEMGMSSVYDEKKAYNFYKTAEFSDQSWGRVYDYLKYLLAIIIGHLAVVFIIILLGGIADAGILLAIGAIVIPTIAFIIGEAIVGRRLAKGASREGFTVPERDRDFEVKVYKWCFGIFAVVYLAFAVFLMVGQGIAFV